MDKGLLGRFEQQRKDYIKTIAGLYYNFIKALTVFNYQKKAKEMGYDYLGDEETIDSRNEIAAMKDLSEVDIAGNFMQSKIYQNALKNLTFEGESTINIITELYKKLSETNISNYWNPMMYPLEMIRGRVFPNCFPFDYEVVSYENGGLFKPGKATLKYTITPLIKDFFDAMLEVAKEEGDEIRFEADAPSNDDPYSSEVIEIAYDQEFTIESKRIKHIKNKDDVWDLFVLKPNVITNRMKLYVTAVYKLGTIRKIIEENQPNKQ